jgi:hypothetical protein
MRAMRAARLLLCSAMIHSAFMGAELAVADDAASGDDSTDRPVSEFVPPDDGHDWLRLTSGEWLRGELIGNIDDQVEFESDILDELTLDAEDVDQFFSPRTFGVSLRDREVVYGRVRVDGDRIIVYEGDQERVMARRELVAIAASAERERDRWSANVSLGANIQGGNTDVLEYHAIAGLERRTPQSRMLIDYIGTFNETEGEQVANNQRVNVVLDRFSGSRLFWRPIIGQYFRDPFQNIQHQGTLETGMGYELIDSERTEWEIFAGLGANYARRVSVLPGEPKTSTSPAGSIGTVFDTELTPWMDYLFSFTATFLDEESGAYQHHMLTTLSTDFVGDFDIDLSFVWDRTERPRRDKDGDRPDSDDYRLLIGIGYEF